MSNQTPPRQQPLELTPAMSVVMVVVMVIGWLGWMGSEDDPALRTPVRPVIKRVTDQSVRIPHCSIAVTPVDGWSHLSIENMIDEEPTFANQSTQTIATFEKLPFRSTEPESTDWGGAREIQYTHVRILWHPHDQVGGTSLIEGWIEQHPARARIRVLTTAKSIEEDRSIASLCNAIEVVSTP